MTDRSRRCSICALNWPCTDEYKTCPGCEGKTNRFAEMTPMDDAEAKSLKAHFEFERSYEERDAKTAPVTVHKQRVVVYEANGELKVYTTAYTDDQTKDAIMDCVANYRRRARVRSVYASSIPPKAA